MSWGDNGSARPTTKEYGDGWDKIFGKKKDDTKREDTKGSDKLSDSKATGSGNKAS